MQSLKLDSWFAASVVHQPLISSFRCTLVIMRVIVCIQLLSQAETRLLLHFLCHFTPVVRSHLHLWNN